MTVAEYEAKFRTLSKFTSWVALDPREKGKKFQHGLKPSIRRLVALCKLEEYADIVDWPHLMENEEEERSKMLKGRKRPQKGGNKGGGNGEKGQKRSRTQQYGPRREVGG